MQQCKIHGTISKRQIIADGSCLECSIAEHDYKQGEMGWDEIAERLAISPRRAKILFREGMEKMQGMLQEISL